MDKHWKALTRQETLKEVGEWLDTGNEFIHGYQSPLIKSSDIELLKQGIMPAKEHPENRR